LIARQNERAAAGNIGVRPRTNDSQNLFERSPPKAALAGHTFPELIDNKIIAAGILHTSRPTNHQKRGQLVDVKVYEMPASY